MKKANRSTHGLHGTPTYRAWSRMKERCYNPKDKDYKRSRKTGITVCDEWHSFPAFLAAMGKRPKGMGLARIDAKIGFVPTNCRWAPRADRATNRRTVYLKAFGVRKLLSAWLKDPRCVVSRYTLQYRIQKLGWKTEKALTTPV